jgi:hypothetical protein
VETIGEHVQSGRDGIPGGQCRTPLSSAYRAKPAAI